MKRNEFANSLLCCVWSDLQSQAAEVGGIETGVEQRGPTPRFSTLHHHQDPPRTESNVTSSDTLFVVSANKAISFCWVL